MIDLNELARQAAQLMVQRHGDYLVKGEIIRIFFTRHQGMRRVRLELHDRKADQQLKLCADLAGSSPEDGDEADDACMALGLDFLDGVLAEHLESGRESLPRSEPVAHSFEGQTVHLSGGLSKPFLEAEADRLLAEAGYEDEESSN